MTQILIIMIIVCSIKISSLIKFSLWSIKKCDNEPIVAPFKTSTQQGMMKYYY